jgi:hypothetical protein
MGFPYITVITNVGTSSTNAYASNQSIGGLNTLTPVPPQGFIQGITITTKSTVSSQIDVMFFRSSMANTTFTNLSSIAISSQDAVSLGPVIHVTDWSYAGTGATVGTANGLAYAYAAGGGEQNSLYCALVARGAVTFASSSDVSVAVTIVS